ncbi:hypothetical protein RHS01_08052 [Rhizoctonia solani]|uniref:Uncharacterized protein n=1 Tax=Rhizoctonia solani TaxID=456999 RepID=A0A8H7I6Q1_9AGAM|nr:hypothetical protein RHS01_08052 [Rhizoctonia solani]
MSNSSEVNVKFIIDTAEGGIISDTHRCLLLYLLQPPSPCLNKLLPVQPAKRAGPQPRTRPPSTSADLMTSLRSFVTFPLANLPTARHRLKLGNYLLLPYRLKSQTTFERYPPQSFSDY